MPIHDWTCGSDAAYHSFLLGWATALSNRLNAGTLPPSYFAMTETIDLRPAATFCTLSEPDGPVIRRDEDDGLLDAVEQPPPTRMRMADERVQYACRVVTVRDDLRQPAAAVVFVTRQDHQTPYRLDAIVSLAVGAL